MTEPEKPYVRVVSGQKTQRMSVARHSCAEAKQKESDPFVQRARWIIYVHHQVHAYLKETPPDKARQERDAGPDLVASPITGLGHTTRGRC